MSQRTIAFTKINEVINNEIKSKNIEISIYNYTLCTVKENKITPKVLQKKTRKHEEKLYNNSLSWNNVRFRSVYNQKCRSIIFNLKNPKNTSFYEKVVNGEISTRTIANLTPEEIYPELWAPILKKQVENERRMLKNKGLLLENAADGCYQCSKCKCKKIDYYSVQTRSADEPMTVYFTCLNCFKRWKE